MTNVGFLWKGREGIEARIYVEQALYIHLQMVYLKYGTTFPLLLCYLERVQVCISNS